MRNCSDIRLNSTKDGSAAKVFSEGGRRGGRRDSTLAFVSKSFCIVVAGILVNISFVGYQKEEKNFYALILVAVAMVNIPNDIHK